MPLQGRAKGAPDGDVTHRAPLVRTYGHGPHCILSSVWMAGAAPPTLERDLAQALHALSKACTRSSGGLTSWLVGGGTQHTDVHAAIAAAEATLQTVSSRTESGHLDEV